MPNKVTLEEAFDLKQGNHLPVSDLIDDGLYDVFGANGIIGKFNKYMYEHPTVLVTCRGATCGRINLTSPFSWVTGNAIAVLPKVEVDTKYLFYQLVASDFKDVISGSAQPQIIVSTLKRKKVVLPRIEKQKQIAHILSQADKARQQRKAANAFTEEFLQSTFLSLFGDPVRNEKGWEVKTLDKLIASGEKISYGVVQPGDDIKNGIPVIRVGDFSGMTICNDKLKRIDSAMEIKYKKTRIKGNEILIACVGSIGKVALVDETQIGCNIVRAVARINPNKNEINRFFLAYYLSTPLVQSYFTNETKTVAQPTLNIKQIEATEILLPPLPLQQQFADIVAQAEALRQRQRAHAQELEALFQGLLQRYFG